MTNRELKRACGAIVGLGALLLSSPAASADQVLVSDPSARFLSAYRGETAWSRADSQRYRLVIRSDGRTGDALVRGFRHPVDADLGPGRRRGEVVAVYARCKQRNRRCDLFQYSLQTRRERKLRRLSSRRRSEYSPSVWNGRYLFGRSARGLLRTGPLLRLSRRQPIDTDLRRARALYSYQGAEGPTVATQRFGRRRRGRECVLFRSDPPSAGGSNTGIGPVGIAGDFLYWLQDTGGPPPGIEATEPGGVDIVRRRRPTSSCPQPPGQDVRVRLSPVGRPTSLSFSRGQLLYTDDRGVVEAAANFGTTFPVP